MYVLGVRKRYILMDIGTQSLAIGVCLDIKNNKAQLLNTSTELSKSEKPFQIVQNAKALCIKIPFYLKEI